MADSARVSRRENAAAWTGPRLLLLRHGEVASHGGDLPLTERGRRQARLAGRSVGMARAGVVAVLAAPTVRTRDTAARLCQGLRETDPEAAGVRPRVSSVLRNPDLYLAGHRVDMVSTAAAFCAQAPGLTEQQCLRVPFFAGFLAAPDRVGYWVAHADPPGEDAAAVAARVAAFATSLSDEPGPAGRTVLGVTHSPLLRAVALEFLGEDPGEPDYLRGYSIRAGERRSLVVEAFDPFGPHMVRR